MGVKLELNLMFTSFSITHKVKKPSLRRKALRWSSHRLHPPVPNLSNSTTRDKDRKEGFSPLAMSKRSSLTDLGVCISSKPADQAWYPTSLPTSVHNS